VLWSQVDPGAPFWLGVASAAAGLIGLAVFEVYRMRRAPT
jgi:hypothetical protein